MKLLYTLILLLLVLLSCSTGPEPELEIILFQAPLKSADNYEAFSEYIVTKYVNHNPENPDALLDWNCGNRTYHRGIDEYYSSHRGTDYYLYPFGWNMMYDNNVEVVAIADGTILYKEDSYADDSCWNNGLPNELDYQNNIIVLELHDGTAVYYFHLRQNSLTNKEEGDSVEIGEYLGLVGSSGMSPGPHLHLEIWDSKDNKGNLESSVDPFFGLCNESIGKSRWINQEAYYNSSIVRIITHSSPPNYLPEHISCSPISINYQNIFNPGETVYLGVYFRDILYGQSSEWRIYNQHNELYNTEIYTFSDSAYLNYKDIIHPLLLSENNTSFGDWRVEIEFEGKVYEYNFQVCPTDDACNL